MFNSISTHRMIAKPLSVEDFQDICELHADPIGMKYVGGPRSEAMTRIWLDENLQHWRAHGFGLRVFRTESNGDFVGRCGLRKVEIGTGPEIELGYSVSSRYWRQSFGTEMARAILDMGLDQIEASSIVAFLYPGNLGSRALAEKLGFQFEREIIWKGQTAILLRLKRADSDSFR